MVKGLRILSQELKRNTTIEAWINLSMDLGCKIELRLLQFFSMEATS
ncbi:hypothetical protein A2U01_0052296, partial [Trifolium medium]|nr:hypothetical protein [Trifolium medium]